MINILNENDIRAFINPKYRDLNIYCFKTVDSTNKVAKEAAKSGALNKSVFVAGNQTCGRGRLGRNFFSPSGCGVYLSIVFRPDNDTENFQRITAAAAVAVCRAIKELTGINPLIKWVNDIIINNKKVCGILTEGVVNAENKKIEYAVVGIGINAFLPLNGYPPEIKEVAGSLFESTEECDINLIASKVIEKVFDIFDDVKTGDFVKEYKESSILIGRNIEYEICGEKQCGKVVDIDENCGLVVENNGKIKHLSSGEVTIKTEKVL